MPEIKKRNFEFTEQETYSKGELENILNQHSKFLSGASAKEVEELKTQLSSLQETNTQYAKAERARTLKKVAKSISSDNYEKILKYTNVADDASEEDIKKAMEDTFKDFAPAPAVSTAAPKVETKEVKKIKEESKPQKKYRFVN